MKYKLSWVEKKHIDKLNKDVLECDATDEQGNSVKFSIWSDFPNFAEINASSTLEGNLWNKPGTTSWTLYPPKPEQTTQGGAYTKPQGGFKAGMAKMVEQKQQGIKEAQETKHEAIKEAGAQRDAVLIVTTFYPELASDPLLTSEKEKVIQEKYMHWREFFLNQPPF